MAVDTNTPKLNLLRIQEDWQFGDEAFNRFIDDADDKLVGISHISSRLHWDLWKKETAYAVNDVVRWENMKSHQYARCVTAGTSSNIEPIIDITGSVVTDGTVEWQVCSLTEADDYNGTIKIWLSGQRYYRGDAVRYGTALYRCNVEHVATNWTADNGKWQEMYASIRMWSKTTYYFENDTVIYNNLIYQCITAHVSENTFDATEEEKWILVADTGGAKEWQTDKIYQKDQLVTYNGAIYKAKDKHTSTTDFATDTSHWDIVYASLPSWVTGVYYPAKTVVYYNNKTYKCLTAHTSGNTTLYDDGANWQILDNTIEEWATNIYYYSGQLVLKENVLYKCNTSHKASNFTTDIEKWDLLYANIQPWTTGIVYKVNSAVLNDGHLYICTTLHTSTVFNDDISNWVEIGGSGAIEDWASGVAYNKDDMVLYNGILYRNNVIHISESTFANDSTYWDIVYASIPIWTTNVYYPVNMIVSYNNLSYKCVSAHTASADFNTDIENWILFNNSITTWIANTAYKAGQVVIHNGLLYKCNENHVSGVVFDPTKFDGFGVDIKHEIPDYPIEQGMNVKVTTDKKLIANDLTKWVRAAGKEEEIDKLGVRDLNNKDIFENWKAYTCNSNGTDWNDETNVEQVAAKNSYSFNTTYDAIICSRNNEAFSAFISQDLYEPDYIIDYTIDNRILAQIDPSLADDDDGLFFIAGFMQDSNGDYHTLSVIRVGDSSHDHRMRFAIAYDVYTSWSNDIGSTAKILKNNTTLIAHDWDGNSYAKLQVEKSTTGIIAKTSQINSDDYAVTLTYTLPATKPSDMTQEQYNNIKYMLEHDTRIGFGTQSNCSAFKLLNSSGSIKRISVYNTDTIKKVTYENSIKISETDDTKVLLPQELLYSELNKRLYYVKGEKDVKEIQLNNLCEEWKSETFYVKDSIVSYNGLIYKCKEVNDDISFDISKWDLLYTNIILWQANTQYFIGNTVIYNNQIYRCITENNDAMWNGSKWQILSAVDTWNANVYYPYHILCVYEGELYRCIIPHTSITTFVKDNWEKLSGSGESGGNGTGYSQVEAYNVSASTESPFDINIQIASNTTHTLHPTDVLKYKEGTITTETMMQFIESDKDKFDYNYVNFDGDKMKVSQKVEVKLNPATNLGTGFLRMSDTIDLNNNFKSIEKVVCS